MEIGECSRRLGEDSCCLIFKKGLSKNLGNYQSYLSPSESYGMNPDEAHDWEKLAWIHQGQIILGKPDCLSTE